MMHRFDKTRVQLGSLVLPLLASFSFGIVQAQCLDSLGLDDVPTLNACEQQVLASLGGEWPFVKENENPVIAFRYSNSAQAIGKKDFFQKQVLPWLRKDDHPILAWYVLDEPEKRGTGGVDAVVVAWSKIGLTKRGKRRVLRQLTKAHGVG